MAPSQESATGGVSGNWFTSVLNKLAGTPSNEWKALPEYEFLRGVVEKGAKDRPDFLTTYNRIRPAVSEIEDRQYQNRERGNEQELRFGAGVVGLGGEKLNKEVDATSRLEGNRSNLKIGEARAYGGITNTINDNNADNELRLTGARADAVARLTMPPLEAYLKGEGVARDAERARGQDVLGATERMYNAQLAAMDRQRQSQNSPSAWAGRLVPIIGALLGEKLLQERP